MTVITTTIADRLREEIRAISQLIDSTYPTDMAPELVMRRRTGKVFEEAGEMADAVNGFWGENPRKGKTHDIEDVAGELLDVALAALAAWWHVRESYGDDLPWNPGLGLLQHAFKCRRRLEESMGLRLEETR
jgi:NTP pyrophosphatase (non-canonical NTP hydrolase)